MKRIVVETPGGPEQMKVVEAPKPAAGPKERGREGRVLRASTSSTSTSAPVCTRPKRRSRSAAKASGTVESVGSEVTEVAPGDRVAYAMVRGSYAEYAARAGSATREDPGRRRLQDGGRGHAAGHDRALPDALHVSARRPATPASCTRPLAEPAASSCRWPSTCGARVFGTVSTEDKARRSRASAPTKRSSIRHRTSKPR